MSGDGTIRRGGSRTRSKIINGTVAVEGLNDFRKALRDVGGDFPKRLQKANKAVVADVIVPVARGKAAAQHPVARGKPRRTPKDTHWSDLVDSIRALAQQNRAQVALGRDRYGWILGYEFGAINKHQFPPWRGSGADAGYFLYPTIREKNAEIIATYRRALEELMGPRLPRLTHAGP